MATILDRIVERKRREVAEAEAREPLAALLERLPAAAPPRDFFAAVSRPGAIPPSAPESLEGTSRRRSR